MGEFYKKLKLATALCLSIALAQNAFAQRLSTYNDIGWYNVFGTINVSKHISIIPEFQWRRNNIITDWQQLLARAGVQYHFNKGGTAAILYCFTMSYPIGDYPWGPYPFPEHRITEQVGFTGSTGIFNFSHRLRLEQRWLGQINQKAESGKVESWMYLNRVRYQLRTEVALNRPKIEDKTFYLAAFDEIFIGFGKNVNQNVFDQNRLGLLGGYRFNKNLRMEAGYLNQIVQQPAPVNNQQVYQYNQGPIVNLYVTR